MIMGKHKIQCPECKGHPFRKWKDDKPAWCMNCSGQGVVFQTDEEAKCLEKNSETLSSLLSASSRSP